MQVGDKITKVNKVNIDKWDQFINEIYISKGENINIEIVRNSKVKTFSLKPIKNVKENRFMIGIGWYTKKNELW